MNTEDFNEELQKKLKDGLDNLQMLSDMITSYRQESEVLAELLNDIKDLEWYKCCVLGCNAAYWFHGVANNGGHLNCEMLYPNTEKWEEDTLWFCEKHYNSSCKIKKGEFLPVEFYY